MLVNCLSVFDHFVGLALKRLIKLACSPLWQEWQKLYYFLVKKKKHYRWYTLTNFKLGSFIISKLGARNSKSSFEITTLRWCKQLSTIENHYFFKTISANKLVGIYYFCTVYIKEIHSDIRMWYLNYVITVFELFATMSM